MNYSLEEEMIERFFGEIRSFIIPSKANNYKSRFLQSNFLLYCVVLLLILKIGAILISINIPQNIFFADITKSALQNFVNQTRQSMGLRPLSENAKLNQAAEAKAANMVQYQYFAHTSPSGVSPWFWFSQAGYSYKYAGENLAIGFFDSQEVYNAWLNSPSHKANILNPHYTEVGTAVLSGFGPNNTIVVVQEFGSPLPAKPVASTKPKPIPVSEAIEPVPAASTQAPASTKEQVLSQETDSNATNSLPYKVANAVLYDYDEILQNITYGVAVVIIGILLTLIFFSIDFKFKRALVFRAVLIVVLLSAATLINKEAIISLIPHQMMI